MNSVIVNLGDPSLFMGRGDILRGALFVDKSHLFGKFQMGGHFFGDFSRGSLIFGDVRETKSPPPINNERSLTIYLFVHCSFLFCE